tara:strand:+ start:48 stop:1085 length:1038 start_codon:yes stop_codon:yes gene_type:complete
MNLLFNENELDYNIFKIEKITLFKIENKNIIVTNNTHPHRKNLIVKFLKDIINIYPNLKLNLYLCLLDYVGFNKIDIIDIRKNKIDDPHKHKFEWGNSKTSDDIFRIVNSKQNSFNCPVFTFTKYKYNNCLPFPSLQLISFQVVKDNILFENKKNNILCMRNSNICCDLNNISRIKSLEYSFKNPSILDFKLGSKNKHSKFGNYVINKALLNLYKYEKIIDEKIDNNDFIEYFNYKNYISCQEIIENNKYLFLPFGGRYLSFYKSNCLLFRYKNDDWLTYEDYIFGDSLVKIDFNEIEEKINYYNENETICKEIIKKRLDIFNKRLKYDNLVKEFGLYLVNNFSK